MDFNTMTADQIKNYQGPIYRVTVSASRRGDPKDTRHDFESTTMEGLFTKIQTLHAAGYRIYTATYGPHTPDRARLAIEDSQPMPKILL